MVELNKAMKENSKLKRLEARRGWWKPSGTQSAEPVSGAGGTKAPYSFT